MGPKHVLGWAGLGPLLPPGGHRRLCRPRGPRFQVEMDGCQEGDLTCQERTLTRERRGSS